MMYSLHHGISLLIPSSQEIDESLSVTSSFTVYKGIAQARKYAKARNIYLIGLETKGGNSGSWPEE